MLFYAAAIAGGEAGVEWVEAAVFEQPADIEPTPTNGSANWDVPGHGERGAGRGIGEHPGLSQAHRSVRFSTAYTVTMPHEGGPGRSAGGVQHGRFAPSIH
jgi:hypothetical protein